ncbi:MAG: AraC family transcriptional regulator [Myxococcota bacterium]
MGRAVTRNATRRTGYFSSPVRHLQMFDAVRSVYGRQPGDRVAALPSATEPHSIDMAFVGHVGTVVRMPNGRHVRRDILPGSGGVHGELEVDFVEVEGPSEYIELAPTRVMREDAAAEFRAPAMVDLDELPGIRDEVLWSAACVFRANACGTYALSEIEAEEITRQLVAHFACTYFGGLRPRTNDRRLDAHRLRTLRDMIESQLAGSLTLSALAHSVYLSPYHFSRSLKATLGLTPSQYVQSIRMQRALRGLLEGQSVAAAAASVGYGSTHTFRRTFRRFIGVRPSAI